MAYIAEKTDAPAPARPEAADDGPWPLWASLALWAVLGGATWALIATLIAAL